jgi:hypothetical protein
MHFARSTLAAVALTTSSFALAQDRDPSSIPGRTMSSETSDRTPGERNPTPSSQVYATKDGETSTRTPGPRDDQSATGTNTSQNDGASQSASDSGSEGSRDRAKVMAMSIDTLRSSLKEAGFRNIRVVDATYLVHATTSDGNVVVMTVNPPSLPWQQARSGQSDERRNQQSGRSAEASSQ